MSDQTQGADASATPPLTPVPTPPPIATAPPALPMDRDSIRARILKRRVSTREVIDFFGDKIEMRQPTLADILKIRAASEDGDQNAAVINTLVEYAYIPGTETKIFEIGDAEALLQQPFGDDFVRVTEALGRLTSINFDRGGANSSVTPSASPS